MNKKQTPKTIARAIPSSKQGETPGSLQQNVTELSTYFTIVGGTRLIYSADRWVIVRLTLQSAGPVDVGTRATLTPVGSGKGRSLVTGQEFTVALSKGERLYITAAAVNRVLLAIEPIPWAQQISGEVVEVGRSIVRAVRGIRLGGSAASPAGPSLPSGPDCPMPTPSRKFIPKLRRNRGR